MAAILESLTFPADLFPGDDVLTSELATLTGPAEPLVAPIAPWNVGRTLPAEHPAVAAARPELRLVHSATVVEPDARAVRPRPVAVPTPAPVLAAVPRPGSAVACGPSSVAWPWRGWSPSPRSVCSPSPVPMLLPPRRRRPPPAPRRSPSMSLPHRRRPTWSCDRATPCGRSRDGCIRRATCARWSIS